jgi:hypothetical protein
MSTLPNIDSLSFMDYPMELVNKIRQVLTCTSTLNLKTTRIDLAYENNADYIDIMQVITYFRQLGYHVVPFTHYGYVELIIDNRLNAV